MSFFSQFASALAGGGSGGHLGIGPAAPGGKGNGTPGSALREDMYKAINAAQPWLASTMPGDGISFRPILDHIIPHFPKTTIQFAAEEIPIIVGAITNMVLELSKLDGMQGVIAMRTWTDALGASLKVWNAKGADEHRRDVIREGVMKGINVLTDHMLLTREFAARLQMIGYLKGGKSLRTPFAATDIHSNSSFSWREDIWCW